MALDPIVYAMADAAHATVSRRDLVAVGIKATTIDTWVADGVLERRGRGEYRIPGSGDPTMQRVALKLWRAGEGARLAGPLACGLLGLDPFTTDEDSYVAVPHRRRVRSVDFRVVRTPVPLEDQALNRGLPGVTVERALISAAAVARPSRVRAAFYRAKYLGLTTEDEIAVRAVALGRVHGAPQMRHILGTGALAVESPKELDLLRIFAPGDPQPKPQVWVCWRAKWHRLDFAFCPARVAMEYDGESHAHRREEDADRDLALMEMNIQTIRVTKQMLRDPADTRRRILSVVAARLAAGVPPLVPQIPPWL